MENGILKKMTEKNEQIVPEMYERNNPIIIVYVILFMKFTLLNLLLEKLFYKIYIIIF